MQTALESPSVKKYTDWLKLISVIYLAIPMLIFVLGYCRWYISIPFTLIECWILVRVVLNSIRSPSDIKTSVKEWLPALLILAAWVLLSGIGGYAFQNADHDFRNAIFRDLVRHQWPVVYSQSSSGENVEFGLIYYFGYWLPSSLIGKWLGWQAANFALFCWTLLGVSLTTLLIQRRIGGNLARSAFLLIFFSGMDFLAVLILKSAGIFDYPSLWPPVTQLEWWANLFQYSSFTTQLFWIFNQALPSWIAMGLILTLKDSKTVFLIWSLVFFLSPIPALGILPFVLLTIPKMSFDPEIFDLQAYRTRTRTLMANLVTDIKTTLSIENLVGGGLVSLVSAAYFSANPSGTRFSIITYSIPELVLLIVFLLLEFFLLWILIKRFHKRDLWWLTCGILLIGLPFLKIGNGYDLLLHSSIPALFLLMVWSGEALRKPSTKAFKTALIVLLAIGALTPLYEINRSVYRTVKYYVEVRNGTILPVPPDMPDEPVPFPPEVAAPELVHPNTLTADEYQTMTYFDLETLGNYVGKVKDSFFFQYFVK